MSKNDSLLKLKNVSKFYYNNKMVSTGFSRVNLEFNLGEFVVITGESGSGKSTLLNVISGLDSYEEGEMYINGEETSHYKDADFEQYRKTYIGSIFQSFNLVNSYTVYQNVELALLLNGYNKKDIKDKVLNLIKQVDLYRYRNTRVSHLSGGQKQRVAIARALAKDTPIIIADEPTGNLDSKSAKSVLKLLAEIAKEKLVIVVTHNYDQVEMYATRKIEMNDGKVREDIELKSYKIGSPVICEYKDITLFNKISLGVRNTFNILPKFILMAIVFLFITTAFLGEYSSFKKNEYLELSSGDNYYFMDNSDTRIIVNKDDHTPITKEDILNLENLKNVKKVNENDLLIDEGFSLNGQKYYFYGNLYASKELDHVDIGRLPQKEDEILIYGRSDDYLLVNYASEILEESLELYSQSGLKLGNKYKIVGINYSEENLDYEKIYVTSELLESARQNNNISYSKVNFKLNNFKTLFDRYSYYMQIIPLHSLSKGQCIINENYNYYCKNNDCNGNEVVLDSTNIYYNSSVNLTVKNTYNKYNYKSLTNYTYEEDINHVFISYEDFNALFNDNIYQVSIYVDNYKNVDSTIEMLKSMNYNTLALKDAQSNSMASVLAIIKIFKLIVLIVLFIVLFFIAYFVIKLIQKSKNVYYATVRILGASKKDISSLIKIELYTIFNITYLAFMLFVILVKTGLIKSGYITELTAFLEIKDYVMIYLLMFAMSFLIAVRYSKKLFKSTAMKAYNEEA